MGAMREGNMGYGGNGEEYIQHEGTGSSILLDEQLKAIRQIMTRNSLPTHTVPLTPNVTNISNPPTIPETIKSVNKNAFEIRGDILKFAIDTVTISNRCETMDINVLVDTILRVANRFYEFVAPPRNNRR